MELQKFPAPFINNTLYCDVKLGFVDPTFLQHSGNWCLDICMGCLTLANGPHLSSSQTALCGLTQTLMSEIGFPQSAKHAKYTGILDVSWYLRQPQSFSHIHIDTICPLPMCQGYQFSLAIVGHFSHWPTAIPIKDTSANTVSKAVLRE